MANLDRMTADVLSDKLVQENVNINDLDIKRQNQREAFLAAIKKRKALLTKIEGEGAEEKLKLAITENHEYFVQLNREQYTDSLAQTYIRGRLKSDSAKNKKAGVKTNDGITLQKSLDEKNVFNYTYATPDGDELFYYDNEIEIPLALKSSIKVSLKLVDAIAFIDKVDTHITQLGEKKIKSVINDTIANLYKSFLSEYISKNNVGYYTLCSSLGKVEGEFSALLGNEFAPYGINVTAFFIKKIAIPSDIQHKIEDMAFKLRQRRVEVEADAEFAKLSLETYESKLALHAKYPDAEITLSEYEKDNALHRYLEKNGILRKDELDHSIELKRVAIASDEALKKDDDIIPTPTEQPNSFKKIFFTLLAIFSIISIIVTFNAAQAGLIMLAIVVAIFGIVASFNTDKFSSKPASSAYDTNDKKEN